MRSPQPWSDAARQRPHPGAVVRRRKVQRFTEHLVDIVYRDIEDARTADMILGMILKTIWAPLMFAGAVGIRHLTGAPTWSLRELAVGLSASIIVGMALAQIRGNRDAQGTDDPPDPYGPAQEDVGFTTLRRRD